ncbi:MAG: antibiotic biosynthesis monooxygenase [Trueperaceae bacterium]|nr:antibiotic biosynthesis monooxygenase [Trueperaceae bacterium]
MPQVRLTGQLVCKHVDEVATVIEYLPPHASLTRAEPGCLSFEVKQTEDPFIWQVEERFIDAAAFAVHQERVAASEWGRMTSRIERRYVVEETDRAES